MSLSTAVQLKILEALFQSSVLDLPSPLYVGLHNAAPGEDQSLNESGYSGYARLAVYPSPSTFLVTAGPPARAQNLSALAFPPCTGPIGDTLNFWSIGTQPSGPGQLITSGPIGNGQVYGFSADVGDVALFVPLLPSGFVIGQAFTVSPFGPGMLLPGGLVDGAIYYATLVMTESLLLSATPSGQPITFSTPGSGLLYPVTPVVVAQGVVPTFPPNSLLTFQG